MGKSFYLTTTLPYVNADPHIGFALEIVQADIVARYRTLMGDDVFFNTGTDEHGLKIYRKALAEGKEPQAYVDEYAAKFRALKEKLNLHPGVHFIRTTDPKHKAAAQELWRRCFSKGDIYKKKYKGLYCVGGEAFLKETDLVNGKCPNHPTMDPIEIEEENYFFKLNAYQEKLLTYLAKPGVITPEWRREEAILFVKQGLEDFSISRDKSRMNWGVPVPGDDTQIIYVWFDALTNYISTLGWPEDKDGNFKKFWVDGETMQMAGKDQVRFQSIMWQAMLMSAELPTTQRIAYHGFITSGGQKMSKSIGNVIDPYEIVEEYGVDALRYFLARHISPFEDSDFTMEKFKDAYNANLANGLGNLVSRIMKMATANGIDVSKSDFSQDSSNLVGDLLDRYEFNGSTDKIWSDIGEMDRTIQETQPFQLIKTDPESAKKMIQELGQGLAKIAVALKPFLPNTAQEIERLVKNNEMPTSSLFPRKETKPPTLSVPKKKKKRSGGLDFLSTG